MRREIEEFRDEMEKIPSNYTEMKRQFGIFSKMAFTKDEANMFVEALRKYINIIIKVLADQEYRIQIKECRKWFYVLLSVVRFDIGESFVEKVTLRIFQIVIEDNIYSCYIKNEALKIFIACIEQLPYAFNRRAVQELPANYLNKIFNCIHAYGDYDFQDTLIGTIFYIYGKEVVDPKLPDLIPQSKKLRDSFTDINFDTMFQDTRTFLNILNKNSKKIFSAVCKDIFLGDVKCSQPVEKMDGFWVDFNLSENSVSWYCANQVKKNDAELPNMILFFDSDLEFVRYRRSSTTQEGTVHFKLKVPYISYEEYARETRFDVKFVISLDSDQATILIQHILPVMFRDKYRSIPETSLGTKVIHKPLGRSACSEIKSDVSRSADRVRGTQGGSKQINSSSSASATLEVINISDESVEDVEPCPDVIYNTEQNTQGRPYLTVELCQLETLNTIRCQPGSSTCRSSCYQTTEASLPNFPNRKEMKISRVKHQAINKKRSLTSKPLNKSQKKANLNRNKNTNIKAEHEPSTSKNISEHMRYFFRNRDHDAALQLQQRDEACSTEDTKKSQKGTGSDVGGEPNPDANKENWTQYQCYKNSDISILLHQTDELLASLSHLSSSKTSEDELEELKKNDSLDEQKEEGKIVEVEEKLATIPCGGQKNGKSYDADDPSYLEKMARMEQTRPIRTTTCRKKQVAGIETKRKIRKPNRSHKSVKMSVKGQSISGLKYSFYKMLGAFKEAANATFSGTLQFNLTMNKSGLTSRRVQKKNIRKGVKRLRSTTEEASFPPVGAAGKINIISVVRIVPEHVPRKKIKITDSSTGGPESTANDAICD